MPGRPKSPTVRRQSARVVTVADATITDRQSNAEDLRSRHEVMGASPPDEVTPGSAAVPAGRGDPGKRRPCSATQPCAARVASRPSTRGERHADQSRRRQRPAAAQGDRHRRDPQRLDDVRRRGAHRVPRADRHRDREPARRAAAGGDRLQDLQEHARPPGRERRRASPSSSSSSRARSRSRSCARTAATRSPRRRRCATSPRRNPNLIVKGGILGTRLLTTKDVEALADVPPRDELLARLAGGFQAPAHQGRRPVPGLHPELRLRPQGLRRPARRRRRSARPRKQPAAPSRRRRPAEADRATPSAEAPEPSTSKPAAPSQPSPTSRRAEASSETE